MTQRWSRTRKYVGQYGFLSFERYLSNKYGNKILDTAAKTGLKALKAASENVFHKVAEATGKFKGSKIADKVMKPKPVIDKNSRDVEELVYFNKKRWRIIKWIKTIIIKAEHHKISKFLNDRTGSKFVARKWIGIDALSDD